ncbi:MAG: hypothetical protein QM778_21000 [Myxococcales bacterium]
MFTKRPQPVVPQVLAGIIFVSFVAVFGGWRGMLMLLLGAPFFVLALFLERLAGYVCVVALERQTLVLVGYRFGRPYSVRLALTEIARAVRGREYGCAHRLRLEMRHGQTYWLTFMTGGRNPGPYFDLLVNHTNLRFPEGSAIPETVRMFSRALSDLGVEVSEDPLPTYPRVRYWPTKD